jgi:hypothetical protein
MPTPLKTDWLRADTFGHPIAVDREANVLRGYVVAQLGPFKDLRGEFDRASLEKIVDLMRAERIGLKSRLGHPTLSDDGVAKYLGRVKDGRLDGDRVRGDLHLDKTALDTPVGGGKPLGEYVMDRAESDPDAISSSLVLQAEKTYRLDERGRRQKGDDGEDLPPLWTPKQLHASDVVAEGAAVDGILGVEGLPDDLVRQACDLLDQQFPDASREVIHHRAVSWLGRYLDHRFGRPGLRGIDPEIVRRRLKNVLVDIQ